MTSSPNKKRQLPPEEVRALALLEDCIRFYGPTWKPQFWGALETVRASLEAPRD